MAAVDFPNLFDAQSGNASGTKIAWNGGIGTFQAWGAFEGATCKLQMAFDSGGAWTDVGDDVSFTAAGVGNFQLAPCWIRADLSGGGSPSPSVSAHARPA